MAEDELKLEVKRLSRRVKDIARKGRPVLAGPFLGEVGFELLYWVPLLRWAVARHPELRSRITIVSRGGTSAWAKGAGRRYTDVFSLAETADLPTSAEPTKQMSLTRFDRQLVTAVRGRADHASMSVLHPSAFYRLYRYARRHRPYAFAEAVRPAPRVGATGLAAVYRPIVLRGDWRIPELPDRYFAVRFYARPSFPNDSGNRRLVLRTIDALRERRPVVLMHHGLKLDDHAEFRVPDRDSLIRLPDLARPETNLGLQTRVVAGARALVCTYGGLAYLGPMLRTPTVALCSESAHTLPWHLELARRVFDTPGFGTLTVLAPDELSVVKKVVGGKGG